MDGPMDPSSGDNRLLAATSNNHQAWIWFTHVFLLVLVLVVGGMRAWKKMRNASPSDAVLLIAHVRFALPAIDGPNLLFPAD